VIPEEWGRMSVLVNRIYLIFSFPFAAKSDHITGRMVFACQK